MRRGQGSMHHLARAVELWGQPIPPRKRAKMPAIALHRVKSKKAERSGRWKMMIDGIMVPVLGLAVLAALWIVVLYGSAFFGPKTG